MGKRKYGAGEFSPEQYKNNNEWGIARITQHLRDNGFEVVDKEVEDYDVDILAYKNGKQYRYEERSTILGARMVFITLLYVEKRKQYSTATQKKYIKRSTDN
jgi:hypothetical protein